MAQNREPPAYQMYASDFMANRAYRVMTLAGRGLLITMLNECWVNRTLPSNPGDLAKILGYPAKEVAESLPAVMVFFRIEGENLVCPELDDYRAHRDGIRQAQSAGGKAGAGITNDKRRVDKTGKSSSTTSSTPSSPLTSPEMSRAEQRRDEQSESLGQALHDDFDVDDWLADHEANDKPPKQATAAEYLKESGG